MTDMLAMKAIRPNPFCHGTRRRFKLYSGILVAASPRSESSTSSVQHVQKCQNMVWSPTFDRLHDEVNFVHCLTFFHFSRPTTANVISKSRKCLEIGTTRCAWTRRVQRRSQILSTLPARRATGLQSCYFSINFRNDSFPNSFLGNEPKK